MTHHHLLPQRLRPPPMQQATSRAQHPTHIINSCSHLGKPCKPRLNTLQVRQEVCVLLMYKNRRAPKHRTVFQGTCWDAVICCQQSKRMCHAQLPPVSR
jgi:hypothetical protein